MKKVAQVMLIMLVIAGIFSGCKGKEAGEYTLQKGVLSIGMEIGYPPMEYFDSDGETPLGFDVELGKAIAAKLGLEAEFVDQAWVGIFAGVNTNKYDCIISSVTITDDRLGNFNFTRPYINNTQAMVLLKNSTLSSRSPYQVNGLEIAVQVETTSDEFMSEQLNTGANFTMRRYDKVINCFDDLRNGRVDAVVCDSVVAYFYAGDSSSPYEIVWEDSADEYLGICFKKGNDALTKAVDDVLAGFFEDGTLLELSTKIFHQDLISSVKQ